MEITLEKIELVKDRTGVSYKEAKEALEAADGSVVDAIINIEETINLSSTSKVGAQGAEVIDSIKDLIKKGNISRIVIKKDEEVILNFPVNVSIIGAVLAPWGLIAGIIAAFGTKCVIELVKDDGSVIDISEKATDTFGDVVDKGSDFAEDIKDKGQDMFVNVKAKTKDAMKKVKDDADEKREKADDIQDDFEKRYADMKNKAKDAAESVQDATDDFEKRYADVKGKAKDVADDVSDSAKDVKDDVKDDLKKAGKDIKKDLK